MKAATEPDVPTRRSWPAVSPSLNVLTPAGPMPLSQVEPGEWVRDGQVNWAQVSHVHQFVYTGQMYRLWLNGQTDPLEVSPWQLVRMADDSWSPACAIEVGAGIVTSVAAVADSPAPAALATAEARVLVMAEGETRLMLTFGNGLYLTDRLAASPRGLWSWHAVFTMHGEVLVRERDRTRSTAWRATLANIAKVMADAVPTAPRIDTLRRMVPGDRMLSGASTVSRQTLICRRVGRSIVLGEAMPARAAGRSVTLRRRVVRKEVVPFSGPMMGLSANEAAGVAFGSAVLMDVGAGRAV